MNAIDIRKWEAHQAAFEVALVHSKNCRKCWSPIIRDDEGNPGLRSEACPRGVILLDALNRAEAAVLEVSR